MATFLVVHPHLNIYGGGERVCQNVIKSLVAHGQKVEFLTFDFDPKSYRAIVGEEFPPEVTVHSLGKAVKVKPPFTIYKARHHFVQLLKKYQNELNYDYLFSTQSSTPFEPVFLKKAKKNIAYVHFPEIDYDYDRAGLKRKLYLWQFKRWIKQGVKELDVIFCNSEYTKSMIQRYWGPIGISEPVVVYPPVNLDAFWCDEPLKERTKQVAYVGRFIPQKRHTIMKQLAADLPNYEFVSIGGLRDTEKEWFKRFSEDTPKNYTLKPNLPIDELVKTVQTSRVYTHLMEGEHFGIAPMEALAAGCVTLVHNSGGAGEFITEEFRWTNYEDLKSKIVRFMETEEKDFGSQQQREKLWSPLSTLSPKNFEEKIWTHLQSASNA